MSRALSPFTNRDTYRALLFLSTAVPFGSLWFSGLVTGGALVVGVAITPLVIGAVMLLGGFVALAARAESATVRGLLGVPSYPALPPGGPGTGTGLGPLRRVRAVVADGAFWRSQAYLWLRFVAGLPLAVAVLSLVGGGLFLVTSPIHYRWIPQGDGGHGIDLGIWVADTLPETLLLVPVGLVLLVAAAHLVGPLAAPWGRLAYRLLGGSMTDEYRPLTDAQLRHSVVVHGIVVGGIGALLALIWVLTTRDHFWPMWPILALSLPLAIHTWSVQVLTRPQLGPARLNRAFLIHAGVSVVLAAFLSLIWVLASFTVGFVYFWPIWPTLALAVSVLVHLVVLRVTPPDAELERRIEVLTTTRAGAVDAQERELRRIERDLHDGAQARLVALGMNLGMAEQKLATDPESARSLLAEAREGTREALEELRDLARGIHPPILADRGLGAAVAALAARSPVRVEVSVEGERPSPAVESAAYFVAAEALANAGKHAQAGRVEVRIVRSQGSLVVEVTDDGRGGADPSGNGLLGLRRRVEALDGTLLVVSPEGGPTTLRAEMPCE
jgi:signal transduction histidine kinase